MTALSAIATGLGFAATVAVLVLAAVALVVRHYRQRALGEVLTEIEGTVLLHDAMALQLGVASRGLAQVVGNVALVCSDRELIALQWTPRSTLRIRRSDILGVQSVTSHMNKTRGRPLLKVVFRTEEGEDSVAFQVAQLESWLRELEPSSEPTAHATEQAARRRAPVRAQTE